MTIQPLTLNHQTKLTVKIVIEDDAGALACSILLVTQLFTWLWQLSRLASSARYEWLLLTGDLKAAFAFTGKVFVIACHALAYGLGVNL